MSGAYDAACHTLPVCVKHMAQRTDESLQGDVEPSGSMQLRGVIWHCVVFKVIMGCVVDLGTRSNLQCITYILSFMPQHGTFIICF